MRLPINLVLILTGILLTCQRATDGELEKAFSASDPASAGLIAKRLARIDARIQQAVDSGEVAGTVAIIARNGNIGYHKAFGYADKEAGTPMHENAIFRIASMSKLMTTVGTLILYEKGHFDMDTRLDAILPEFSDMKVFEGYDTASNTFVTRRSEKTIRMWHLFTHTSGIVYPAFHTEGRKGYLAAGVQDLWPSMEITLEENVKRIASLPLAHEPGEKWTYGTNMEVLGRVIEKIDGRSFNRFMEEELFAPLGLEDTGFELEEKDWGRVTQVYTTTKQGALTPHSDAFFKATNNHLEWWKRDADVIACGGAGVLSTAYDYARFLQMLLNGGTLEGVRILGRRTVEMLQRPLYAPYGDASEDFGLSVWVLASPEGAYTQHSIGSYGWGGYFYTTYWVDPAEKLVAVIMNQVSPARTDLNGDFELLTYSAIR